MFFLHSEEKPSVTCLRKPSDECVVRWSVGGVCFFVSSGDRVLRFPLMRVDCHNTEVGGENGFIFFVFIV